MNTYLSPPQMDMLLDRVQDLRKGHTLHPGAKAPYLVRVDGEWHNFKTIKSLRKFLEHCTFPHAYRVFRNFDKGVTIDIDIS